ncbi:Lysine biosynthesis regulatory protein LYS14 [Candida viswanathii]|uniref:Lysine biosynthesis regulatory protein LYS14 n=1 Tax=Candida viswanathii TaxID=5486 RepID=A0A367Y4Y4_9ASCO|nr:Lysine biosynthesis regulatory protein LYS14 [Candida viswanathii]
MGHQRDASTATKIKRSYSRGGCKECKRRKIRCPEDKPHCSTCIRLGKECSYPQPGEKVLRVSKKTLSDIKSSPRSAELELGNSARAKVKKPTVPKPLTIQMYLAEDFGGKQSKRRLKIDDDYLTNNFNSENETKKTKKEGLREDKGRNDKGMAPPPPPPTSSNVIDMINNDPMDDLGTQMMLHTLSRSMIDNPNGSPNSLLLSDFYNEDDVNLLASDLNNIVNDIMFTAKPPNNNTSNSTPNNGEGLLDEHFFSPFSYYTPANDINDIPKHVPLEYIKLKTDDERRYLEEFYHEFASQILPFKAFDKTTGTYFNPVRDVILVYASKEPFLLSAILSQGAKMSFLKTGKNSDYENYVSYLSTCLKLLGPALSKNRDKLVRDDLTSNIECILITVLLLTSSNAMTEKLSWRPHLKGAKDIIIKATNSKIRLSKTLILCKVWFADFEILAGTSSRLGGTIKTDCDLDSVINFEDEFVNSVLEQFGLIQAGNFNIMSGYNIQMIYLFRDLSKLLNKKREAGEMFIPSDSLEYIRLISGFFQQYEKVYIDRKCVLSGPISTPVTELHNLVDTVATVNGTTIYISWMDISQQVYALAGLITVFTSILLDPPDLPHIQDLNAKLVSVISFVELTQNCLTMKFPYGFLMIQWPVTVAGINCTDRSQRDVITKFFEICVELGSVSAEITLKRIKQIWELRDKGNDVETIKRDLDDSHIDSVAY